MIGIKSIECSFPEKKEYLKDISEGHDILQNNELMLDECGVKSIFQDDSNSVTNLAVAATEELLCKTNLSPLACGVRARGYSIPFSKASANVKEFKPEICLLRCRKQFLGYTI